MKDELKTEKDNLANQLLNLANLKEELDVAEKTAKELKTKLEAEIEKARQFKTAATEQI